MHSQYLRAKCANPDDKEDLVTKQSGEHVALAVDLACIDLIEQSHHDKCVEDHREVLCWLHL